MEATASVTDFPRERALGKLGRKLKSGAKKTGAALARVAKSLGRGTATTARATGRATRFTLNLALRGVGYLLGAACYLVQWVVGAVALLILALGVVVFAVFFAVFAALAVIQAYLVRPVTTFCFWLAASPRGSLRDYFRAQSAQDSAEDVHEDIGDITVPAEQSTDEETVTVSVPSTWLEEQAEQLDGGYAESDLVFINEAEEAVGPDEIEAAFAAHERITQAALDPMNHDWDAEEPSSELASVYRVIAENATDPKIKGLFTGRLAAVELFLEQPDWEYQTKRALALRLTQLRSQQHIYPYKWVRTGFADQVSAMKTSVEV